VAATQDPKAFATLSETPMTFIYTARDHERTYKHPLIKLGAAGQVEELHYSPPWEVCQPCVGQSNGLKLNSGSCPYYLYLGMIHLLIASF
jgi:hypothetical protein